LPFHWSWDFWLQIFFRGHKCRWSAGHEAKWFDGHEVRGLSCEKRLAMENAYLLYIFFYILLRFLGEKSFEFRTLYDFLRFYCHIRPW
jgi:hypothetical protein